MATDDLVLTPKSLGEQNKRYRQKFSVNDKELFLRILKEHMHDIERKAGDVMTLKRKHEAWRTVLESYNEGASAERDLHQLRLLWKRMKKRSAPLLKEESPPEEFTVMVNPFDINAMNGNHLENGCLQSSSIPTPSPDSSDCFDYNRTDDDDIKPLQIVLPPELLNPIEAPNPSESRTKPQKNAPQSPLPQLNSPQLHIETESTAPMNRRKKEELSAYELRLLAMAEVEHNQKLSLFKKRKQNESLREELLRLKILTQKLKQEKVGRETTNQKHSDKVS